TTQKWPSKQANEQKIRDGKTCEAEPSTSWITRDLRQEHAITSSVQFQERLPNEGMTTMKRPFVEVLSFRKLRQLAESRHLGNWDWSSRQIFTYCRCRFKGRFRERIP